MINEFIKDKLRDHREPERTRLYRGDRMGFSMPKLLACCWTSLTGKPLNEIAKISDVSEGLLRQWRMQADYKETEEEIRSDFASLFVEKFHTADFDSMVQIFKDFNNLLQQRIILILEKQKPKGVSLLLLSVEMLKKITLETAEKQRRDCIDDTFKTQLNAPVPLTKRGLKEVVSILENKNSSNIQRQIAIEILKRTCE